ncbi:MAG: hypothetical protein ACI4TL_04670 [Candidatus Cryptobacteroides sp.]
MGIHIVSRLISCLCFLLLLPVSGRSESLQQRDSALLVKARSYNSAGLWEKSLESYLEVLSTDTQDFEEQKELRRHVVDAMVGVFVCYQYLGDTRSCVDCFSRLYAYPSHIINSVCKKDVKAIYALSLLKNGQSVQAEKMADAMLAMNSDYAEAVDNARNYAYAAVIYSEMGDRVSDAIRCCRFSLEYYNETSFSFQFRKVEVLLGSLYRQVGMVYDALEFFEIGLEKAIGNEDKVLQAFYCNQLSECRLALNDKEGARRYADISLSMVDEVRKQSAVVAAEVYRTKAGVCRSLNDRDSAEFYIFKSLDIYEMLPYTQGNDLVDLDIAAFMLESEEPKDVELSSELLKRLLSKSSQIDIRARATQALCHAYYKLGKKRDCEAVFREFMSIVHVFDQQGQYLKLTPKNLDFPIFYCLEKGDSENLDFLLNFFKQQYLAHAQREEMLSYEGAELIKASKQSAVEESLESYKKEADRLLHLHGTYAIIALACASLLFLLLIYIFVFRDRNMRVRYVRQTESLENEISELKDRIEMMKELPQEAGLEEKTENYYSYFLDRLRSAVPNLTHTEELVCSYILEGKSAREIAQITGVEVASVNMCTYRLRKKMKLKKGDNLKKILKSFAD